MITAQAALESLVAGNQRYVADVHATEHAPSSERRRELVAGQEPFAVILGCADSRVPAELVFDQGLGDLFVVRVAGNVVGPTQIGSVEFAVERFKTPLVVVLGHSNCGAVSAVLELLGAPPPQLSPGMVAIVDRIRPTLEAESLPVEPMERLRQAVRANVRASVEQLLGTSELLAQRVRAGQLLVVGAKYSLARGVVEFFEPARAPV